MDLVQANLPFIPERTEPCVSESETDRWVWPGAATKKDPFRQPWRHATCWHNYMFRHRIRKVNFHSSRIPKAKSSSNSTRYYGHNYEVGIYTIIDVALSLYRLTTKNKTCPHPRSKRNVLVQDRWSINWNTMRFAKSRRRGFGDLLQNLVYIAQVQSSLITNARESERREITDNAVSCWRCIQRSVRGDEHIESNLPSAAPKQRCVVPG